MGESGIIGKSFMEKSSQKAKSREWRDLVAEKPPGYFSTMAGQVWLEESCADVVFIDRPIAWSLPEELGPWPSTEEGVVLRILSLIPGVSAVVVGDYLSGRWTKRSDRFRAKGKAVLSNLHEVGLVKSFQGELWEEWYAVNPVTEPINPSEPMAPNVRGFFDRYRLAILDARMFERLSARRENDLKHLRKLQSVPEPLRDENWQVEWQIYTEIMAKWDADGGIQRGF